MASIPRRISDDIREQVRARLAITGNVRQTAKEFGLSPTAVSNIRDEDEDGFGQLRTYKKEQFIEDAWNNISVGMSMLAEKFTASSAKDIGTTIGILVDKMQLLSGEPTSRSDNSNRNTHEIGTLSAEQAEEIVKSFISKGG